MTPHLELNLHKAPSKLFIHRVQIKNSTSGTDFDLGNQNGLKACRF